MNRFLLVALALLLASAGCASDSADSGAANTADTTDSQGTDDQADTSGADTIVDPQPPGTGYAAVDGLEFTLTEIGGLACTISQDAVTFSFIMGDNEVVIGGGANRYEDGWLGNIDLRVANPTDEPGPVSYYPDLMADGDGIAVNGSSMSYDGPMKKQPPNDGTNPAPVDAGTGTISVTCP